MSYRTEMDGRLLRVFFLFMLLSFAALIGACASGRQWGDLSSRRHFGEVLSEEERKALRRSRRSCLIWAVASLLFALLAFRAIR